MLRNTLSLNRLANVFYVILKDLEAYYKLSASLSTEEKKSKLTRILRLIDVAVSVLDRKTRLKGIGQDFVMEARQIKKQYSRENKNWYEYLNIMEWFKT